jgi:hypothetical protein
MKTQVKYLNDQRGNTRAVQVSISQWTHLMKRLDKYEQMLKLKSDLTRAFAEVKKMRHGKIKKQSLQSFLDEL